MLERGELVVVCGCARDPEAPRRERQLVRAVRERQVEARGLREASQRRQPSHERARLAEHAGAAVPRPDDLVRDPVQLEQLERLGVLARRHLDLVPVGLQQVGSAAGRTARAASW